MSKQKKDDVIIIWKLSNEEKKITHQVNNDDINVWFMDNTLINPDFDSLNKLYNESFIVSGLLDKIQSAVWKKIETDNEDLQKIINKIDHTFLNESLEFYWNAFFEVIREKYNNQKVTRLIPVPANNLHKLRHWWFIQRIWTKTAYFNDFIWDVKERKKQEKVWKKSSATAKTLIKDKNPWYNPNLTEIYHFKRSSLTDINFWKTLYIPVLDQLLLLEQIDQFFSNMFNKGWMWNAIIYVKQWWQIKQNLSDAWKKVLQEFLNNNFSWVKNSWNHALVQTELWKLDLTDDFDVTAFIEKTFELLKKVSIALNVPYEVLLTIVWNKSTAEQADKNFINHKIVPLQNLNISNFTELFSYDYEFEILKYEEIETWNPLDKMKTLTGYVGSSIMTINEARGRLWLEEIEWWNELIQNKQINNISKTEDLIEEHTLDFLSNIQNDFYKNI